MPLWALALLFLLVPVAELYVIYQVGDAIGVLWTFLLLAADSLLGSLLLRSQGRAVWRRFNENLAQGRMPHREVIDGVLLIPPTRAVVRRFLVRRLGRRVMVAGGRPDYDVEGTAREYDDRPRRGLER